MTPQDILDGDVPLYAARLRNNLWRTLGAAGGCGDAVDDALHQAVRLVGELEGALADLAAASSEGDSVHHLGRAFSAASALARVHGPLDLVYFQLKDDRSLPGAVMRDLVSDPCAVVHDVVAAYSQARSITRDLRLVYDGVMEQVLAQQRRPPGSAGRPQRAAPWAVRLARAASRLLPPADRDRYREEYRCELWELASGGASRRAQLAHALRLAVRALPLRAAVLTPRRKKARM